MTDDSIRKLATIAFRDGVWWVSDLDDRNLSQWAESGAVRISGSRVVVTGHGKRLAASWLSRPPARANRWAKYGG